MKRPMFLIISIVLNFIIYYHLTEDIGINATFEEISMTLIASIIVISLLSLVPAIVIYYLKMYMKKVFVPFKKIYLNLYLNISLAFYGIMILIGIMTYFKVTN